MKLKLADLSCDTFDLISEKVPPTVLQLQNISDGCGDLEFNDGLTLLSGLAIRNLLATLEFPISSGRLYTEHAATISHLTCDGRLRNGFAGEFRASLLESDGVCVEMADIKAKTHVVAEGLLVKMDGRGGRIEVGTLTLKDAQVNIGSLLIRLGAFSVSGLKVAWDTGRPRVEAIKAHAKDLHLQWGDAGIDIAAIDVPEGLRVHKLVQVPQVLIGAVEISKAQVRKRAAEHAEKSDDPSEDGPVADPLPALEKMRSMRLDHGVFDTVNGDLDVDTTLSMTLPVIGKRVSTHHFRIPVVGGIIDYHDFERGLSDFEDAFIDIRLRGKKLSLERDIPLIPGLEKPIITWDLEPGDVELASQRLVRLRTLPRFKLAGDAHEDEERAKKSRVKLHRLDFDNIAVALSLDETAVLTSGAGSLRAHIDEIDLSGQLHFDPDPEDEVFPTALKASAKGVGLVADDLGVAGHALSGALTVGSVESFRLGFDELRPTDLALALKNISISGVEYDLELDS